MGKKYSLTLQKEKQWGCSVKSGLLTSPSESRLQSVYIWPTESFQGLNIKSQAVILIFDDLTIVQDETLNRKTKQYIQCDLSWPAGGARGKGNIK